LREGAFALPRLVVAGVASGVGKTTVAVGLIHAFRSRGLRVAAFKCGPDYLDPTYHTRAAASPCQNLDGWMMGRDSVQATFCRGSRNADFAIIEGVMGLFDGASPVGDEGSTGEIAKWLEAPVLLVVNAAGMARSIAALARGFAEFDEEISLAGLVCNRVGSRGHLELLRRAIGSPAILGALPEDTDLAFAERHLGLRTADQDALSERMIAGWGSHVAAWFDLDALLEIARSAPGLAGKVPGDTGTVPTRFRLGVAFDEAFHFYYDENLRRLEELGAELVRFSPLRNERLPEVHGVYLGGGYPELHAEALSANRGMRSDLAAFASRGGPIYAECGGLMYVSSGIRTSDGRLYPMVGLIPGEAVMCDRLQALGYVEVETQERSLLGEAGLRFRGHQFRYSELRGVPEDVPRIYSVRRRRSGEVLREGYRKGNVLASYVHAHWASNPLVPEGFAKGCLDYARVMR
jgi:cobyrinic acid a,c-diamide synthase